ncbi:hypothetical protein NQZ68_030830 [Dissostichus eleginoides]|nr:hypothetical protein NQZ68_030830 [Dissostichus eleginoides]
MWSSHSIAYDLQLNGQLLSRSWLADACASAALLVNPSLAKQEPSHSTAPPPLPALPNSTPTIFLFTEVEHKARPGGRVEDEGRDRRERGEKSKGTGSGKWKREGDHGCHTVSYSICCSAEQSGAAGGGQASPRRGGGEGKEETEGKRRGRQSAQHLSSTRRRSTAGQAQEKTLILTHTVKDKRPGQRVEVKKELVLGRGSGAPPLVRKVHKSAGWS